MNLNEKDEINVIADNLCNVYLRMWFSEKVCDLDYSILGYLFLHQNILIANVLLWNLSTNNIIHISTTTHMMIINLKLTRQCVSKKQHPYQDSKKHTYTIHAQKKLAKSKNNVLSTWVPCYYSVIKLSCIVCKWKCSCDDGVCLCSHNPMHLSVCITYISQTMTTH